MGTNGDDIKKRCLMTYFKITENYTIKRESRDKRGFSKRIKYCQFIVTRKTKTVKATATDLDKVNTTKKLDP